MGESKIEEAASQISFKYMHKIKCDNCYTISTNKVQREKRRGFPALMAEW